MAGTYTYGMGQYLFTKNYRYMTQLTVDEIKYQTIEDASQTKYKDILVSLPTTGGGIPIVQYGQDYFLKLSVPRNRQYTLTLNLKLCPADSNNNPILDRFQQINKINIPPTPEDDDIYNEVVLYQIPDSSTIAVGLIDVEHDESNYDGSEYNSSITHHQGELYKAMYNGEIVYRYYTSNDYFIEVDNFNSVKLIRSWELTDSSEDVVTYKFTFSPKYNLTEGYKYLLIETDRNNLWTNEIQYIDDDNVYNGTFLDLNFVSVELYSINNLLAGASAGTSQIKAGTNTLNHIAIWGHPEQIIIINGEEIKIGRAGFYEIKDYDITSLGVVVEDYNVDRFTIDYEYKIER